MKIKTILLLLALCVTMGVSSQGRIEPGNEVAMKLYKEAAKKEYKNPSYSLAMYESLAKDGYAPAQYIMYKKGKGDKWLEQAAVGGHFEAATGNGFLSQRIKLCEQVVERSRACATRASNGEPISEQEIEMLWDEALVFDQVYRQMELMQGYLFSATIAKDVNFFPPYYKGKKDMQRAQWDLEALCRICRDKLAKMQMEFGQQMDIIKASSKKTAMTANAGTQMRYHDVEYHQAKGKVKSITYPPGPDETEASIREFTIDGKEKGLTGVQYDSNGYRVSEKYTPDKDGSITTAKIMWKDGRIIKAIASGKDVSLTFNYKYNAKDELIEMSTDMGAASGLFKYQYSDYKYDATGNWISRKMVFMGEQRTETRTIVYY